jgi:calcineurin-like phosphoesterase family protein
MARRPLWPGLAVAATALSVLPALTQVNGSAQPSVQRAIVVISDLHMGGGRDESGRWRHDEDFRWAPEFSEFLRAIDAQHPSTVDLVLNGDTFDLPRAETEAAGTLDRVLAAHKTEMNALAAFATRGTNRVVLIPGDRDAALRLEKIADRVVRTAGGSAGRVTVASAGYWLSQDGKVHAEHGHELRFRGPDSPALQALYDQLEALYPSVDNVAVIGSGAKYALAADNTLASGDSAALLVRDALLNVSWQQFRMELDDGEVQPPRWDLEQARKQSSSLLVSSFADDDPLKAVAARIDSNGGLAAVAADLTDQEITALCDYRAAMRRARRRFEPVVTQFAPRGPIVTECPRTAETRGAIFDYFWRTRDELYGTYVKRALGRSNVTRSASVFVIGHTHLADRTQSYANMISGGLLKIPMEGFSPVRGALRPIVINGGAWNRTITPVQLERLKAERNVSWHELLTSLDPGELPPCYSFVQVPAYDQDPSPAVRYWRRATDGTWGIAPACVG